MIAEIFSENLLPNTGSFEVLVKKARLWRPTDSIIIVVVLVVVKVVLVVFAALVV